jgi:hypothetical protein
MGGMDASTSSSTATREARRWKKSRVKVFHPRMFSLLVLAYLQGRGGEGGGGVRECGVLSLRVVRVAFLFALCCSSRLQ